VNIYHVLRGIEPTLSRRSFSEGGHVRILAEEAGFFLVRDYL
jgi:hypothetical protein